MTEYSSDTSAVLSNSTSERSRQYNVLLAALLSWLFGGMLMAIVPLTARSATISMGIIDESLIGQWFARYLCALLLGSACGGPVFGALGDRMGRTRAMAWSVLVFSVCLGLANFARDPWTLSLVWFVAFTGVGGVWPNGVSLTTEVWQSSSRAWIAGVFGTAANVGLVAMALLAVCHPITRDNWRWVTIVGIGSLFVGLYTLKFVPESPSWIASRDRERSHGDRPKRRSLVTDRHLLKRVILGIFLGTVPLMGNWGSVNWLMPWADRVSDGTGVLSALTQWTKSGGAVIGALLGGWFASVVGPRLSYILISLASLTTSALVFWFLHPEDPAFLPCVFLLGFVGTMYFGWLPLCLPKMFPIDCRATGTGIAFNTGRVLAAAGVIGSGLLMLYFDGDYARVGRVTCLSFALGLLLVLVSPALLSADRT